MESAWIVQSNLSNSVTLEILRDTCKELGLRLIPVSISPGAKSFPEELPDGPLIAHGATTLVELATRDQRFSHGVFYAPENFCHSAYRKGYEGDYINAEAEVVTWEEALEKLADGNRQFVKPPDDLKSFTGLVASRTELQSLYDTISKSPLPLPDKVVIGRVHEVDAEWRIFVIEGKIISGSMYRPSADSHLPFEVQEFVNQAIERWVPAAAFVIDVGRISGEWRVIECNCINWSRFYNSNAEAIVKAMSHYQLAHW